MATTLARKVTVKWQELSMILSEAGVLLPDEDIDNLTLTKPRCLLLHTSRPVRDNKEE